MFYKINNEKSETRDLHPVYSGVIEGSGALVGALHIKSHLVRESHPVYPSVINPYLCEIRFGYWEDPYAPFTNHKDIWQNAMGSDAYKRWVQTGGSGTSEPEKLFAWTIPLLIESQLQVMAISPHPAQKLLFDLVKIAVSDQYQEMNKIFVKRKGLRPNSEIIVFLFAGKVLFTQTCHTKDTVNRWTNEMEAATVLILPQLILEAQQHLNLESRKLMNGALSEQINDWTFQLPGFGKVRKRWPWLPNFE